MAIEGALKCVKFLMCLFNLIFLILGITLVIMGIVVSVQFNSYPSDIFQTNFLVAPIFILLLGVIISLISFFGCYGAMQESRCMIKFFSLCVFLVLLAQIACVIYAFTKKNEVEDAVRNVLNSVVQNYYENNAYKDFMDVTQETLNCCGVHSYMDYKTLANVTEVPRSCCTKGPAVATCNTTITPKPHPDINSIGCQDLIINFLKSHINVLAILALVVSFVELLAIIFGICLSRKVDQYEMV